MRIKAAKVGYVTGILVGLAGCSGKPTVAPDSDMAVEPQSGAPAAFTPKKLPLSVVYQSNRYGTLEPCGCQSKPYGGIDREANAVAQYRKGDAPVLYVDAGNTFAPEGAAKRLSRYREKAKALHAMLNDMGLDVVAPGPTDYALGTDFLKELQSGSSITWVSTNVRRQGKPVFSSFAVIERGGAKFAVLSATAPGSFREEGTEILDPDAALDEILPVAAKAADFVILLSQLGVARDEALAARYSQLGLIVGADPQFSTNEPLWVKGRTLVLDTHINGYLLGKLDLELKLPNPGFYSPETIEKNRKELSAWEGRLKADPSNAIARQFVERIRAEDSLEPIAGGSLYRHELVALDAKRFGQTNAISKAVAKEKERVRREAIASE